MPPEIRQRTVEFRAAEDAPEGVVRGYVTTWDDPYNIGWGWKEEIARGAFTESLRAQPTLPVFYQHAWDDGPIGIFRSLTEDETGLLAEAELFLDDPRARSIFRSMQAGALREWSIGFYPEEITELVEASTDRVTKGRLAEASVVVRGANPNTQTIEVRTEPTYPAKRACGCVDISADVVDESECAEHNDPGERQMSDAVIARLSDATFRQLVRDGLI